MKPYYEDDAVSIYHGDAIELCAEMNESPDICIDVVITDPPYSHHVHGNFMSGHGREGEFGKSKELGFDFLSDDVRREAARLFGRLTARWVAIFSDVESLHLWRSDLTSAGLEYIRTGAWIKTATTPQFSGDRPSAGFEPITLAHPKGRKQWNGGGGAALWTHQIVKGGTCMKEFRDHTTQKPLSLMLDLVGDFSNEGETILDAFMGSGTTLAAAKRLNRHAIGVEINEIDCEKAANRMRLIERQESLGFKATQEKMFA